MKLGRSLGCLRAKRRSVWVQCGGKGKIGTDEAGEVNRGRAAVYSQRGCIGHSYIA